jgi:hypothetical protein
MADFKAWEETLYGRTWPAARYRFVFEVTVGLKLPPYAGSMIRGAFGHALRRTSCMTHMKECGTCPLFSSCPYAVIFEPRKKEGHVLQDFSGIPHPYIFEAPVGGRFYRPGEHLFFDLVLIGQARYSLALLIYSLEKAFLREVGHGKARLLSVRWMNGDGNPEVYAGEGTSVSEHDPVMRLARPASAAGDVTVRLETLLRLQKDGKIADAHTLDAYSFLTALTRRIGLLMEFYSEKIEVPYTELAEAARSVSLQSSLEWRTWTRYSSRQNTKMDLYGLMGDITFINLPEVFVPVLQLGEWFHVGKMASFGLGKYRIL